MCDNGVSTFDGTSPPPYFFVSISLCRLEIVRDRADANGDRNLAGRMRERMRVIAEEAVVLDSDRFENVFTVTLCLHDHLHVKQRLTSNTRSSLTGGYGAFSAPNSLLFNGSFRAECETQRLGPMGKFL